MQRIYHPYNVWEDYLNGMWRKASVIEEKDYLQKAIDFTGNHVLYGSWMNKVIISWPIACEHNLTDVSINRKAWIGHAAVAMAINCPEYITRSAWGYLTKQQQDLANNEADNAINSWHRKHFVRPHYQLKLF